MTLFTPTFVGIVICIQTTLHSTWVEISRLALGSDPDFLPTRFWVLLFAAVLLLSDQDHLGSAVAVFCLSVTHQFVVEFCLDAFWLVWDLLTHC